MDTGTLPEKCTPPSGEAGYPLGTTLEAKFWEEIFRRIYTLIPQNKGQLPCCRRGAKGNIIYPGSGLFSI